MHPNPQPPASSPQLRLVNSAQSIAPRLAFALAIASSAWAQNVVFSTHDWTASSPAQETLFKETWADVKMPGGFPPTQAAFPVGFPATFDTRHTYAVGTIEVNRTLTGSLFSTQLAEPGTGGPPTFSLPSGGVRQVAMLQFNDVANGNFTQRYFYGESVAFGGDFSRATNARGLSVWRTGNAFTDRIAICGETYDERLLGSQAPLGWANANTANSSGFIAVYNGNGDLLWTHHFFDPANPGTDACAITDVSIRVDGEGNDVVTYCGISSHGGAAGGDLAPLLPFPSSGACNGGSAPLPAGQWDGIVGRVVFAGSGPSVRVFHSIVGGPGQDGLFGIVELDEGQFAVAGSAAAATGAFGFPFPSYCGSLTGPYVVGAVLVFDASATGGGGALVLARGEPLGSASEGRHTMARDVHVGRDSFFGGSTTSHMIYVVGSTDDPAFSSGLQPFIMAPPAGLAVRNGPTDGFVAALVDGTPLVPWTFAYHGGPGDDGLTGVHGWSEFSEHLAVVGFTDDGAGLGDIDVATYFFNNAIGGNTPNNTGPLTGSLQLLQIRRSQFGGVAEDRPAVMGAVSATTSGLAWTQFGLGQESGGGVAVGPEGRVNVVGRTTAGGGFPVVGGGRGADLLFDAVRTEVDMVPSGALGVGRTDGTGFQGGGPGPFPPPLASGFTGGTTPFCAQAEFGIQIGLPAPGMPRMLVDFEGVLAAGSTDAAIIVSRPTADVGSIAAGVLQIGFPPAVPWVYVTGAEFWLGGGANIVLPAFGINQSYRQQLLAPLPAGGGVLSAQLVCLLSVPVVGSAPGCASLWTASPAIWFGW